MQSHTRKVPRLTDFAESIQERRDREHAEQVKEFWFCVVVGLAALFVAAFTFGTVR